MKLNTVAYFPSPAEGSNSSPALFALPLPYPTKTNHSFPKVNIFYYYSKLLDVMKKEHMFIIKD